MQSTRVSVTRWPHSPEDERQAGNAGRGGGVGFPAAPFSRTTFSLVLGMIGKRGRVARTALWTSMSRPRTRVILIYQPLKEKSCPR